jgi:chromosome segregation ATPase
MSEDLTQNLPTSFQERVLAEFATIRQEFANLNTRLTSVENRMISLEDRLTSVEDRLTSVENRLTSVENRLTSVENRLTSVEDRVLSIDTRLNSLEHTVDARLRETRPIWEGVQQRLTEIEKGVNTLARHFKTMVTEEFDLRARVEKLEDSQPMP